MARTLHFTQLMNKQDLDALDTNSLDSVSGGATYAAEGGLPKAPRGYKWSTELNENQRLQRPAGEVPWDLIRK